MNEMKQLLNRLFGNNPQSKEDAKQRLKILLIHDQVDLNQGKMDEMRKEILEVVHRYLEVDDDNVTFQLDSSWSV